jgi:hypothetical protein
MKTVHPSSGDEYFRDYHAPSHPRDKPRDEVTRAANILARQACDMDFFEWR